MRNIFSYFWKKPQRFYWLTFGVILVDQVIKMAVKLTLGAEFHESGCMDSKEIAVLGSSFKITFAENPGAAFSMTFGDFIPWLGHSGGKIVLSVFSFLAIFVIVYFLHRVKNFKNILPWAVALILGGALGNIFDRVFYGLIFCDTNCSFGGPGDPDYYPCTLLFGRVVDMFYLDIGDFDIWNWVPFFGGNRYHLWPIFNIADSAISTGIAVILLFQRRLFGGGKLEETFAKPKAETEIVESPEIET